LLPELFLNYNRFHNFFQIEEDKICCWVDFLSYFPDFSVSQHIDAHLIPLSQAMTMALWK
jgi:hypothetical protein